MRFYTSRLICAPLTLTDLEDYCGLYCDAQVMHKIAPAFTYQQAEKNFHISLKKNDQGLYTQLAWTIRNKESQQFLGIQGLIRHAIEIDQAEAGIMLVQQASNKGIATEAIAGLLQFGFSELQLKRIFAHFHPTHKAVEIFVRKLGFVIEDDVRQTKLGEAKYCFIEKCNIATK